MHRFPATEAPALDSKSRKGRTRGHAWSGHGGLVLSYLVVAIVLFALLAFAASRVPYFGFDLTITHAVQSLQSPAMDALMRLAGESGFFPQVLLLNALFIAAVYLCRMRWAALVLLIGGSLTGAVTTALRYTIDRPRPGPDLVRVMQVIEKGHYSFPSGHVTGFVAVLGFIMYLGYTRARPSWRRNLLLFLYSVYLILIGISRIYVGEHWPSDVIAGYLLGSIFLVLMSALYEWGRARGFGGRNG